MPVRMRIRLSILMPDPTPRQCQLTCFICHVSLIGINCQHFNVSDIIEKGNVVDPQIRAIDLLIRIRILL